MRGITNVFAHLRQVSQLHGVAHTCVCVAAVFLVSSSALDSGEQHSPTRVSIDQLEISRRLQRAATSALGGREGTVIVMDTMNGQILALANSRLALEEATAPGSTIKVFTELTALREAIIDKDTRAECLGRYEDARFKFNCSHPPRQPAFDVVHALAHSCNNYFGKVGARLEGLKFKQTLTEFGFGHRTGFDEREAEGILPRERFDIATALGESRDLLVTPIQMITAYAALVNGGHLLVPQRSGRSVIQTNQRATIQISDEHRSLLLVGMRGATTYGTAARARLRTAGLHIFGKTGTSTPVDDFRPQGWFVGFAAERKAGNKDPEPGSIRVGVLVLLKRAHGSDSAIAARTVFNEYEKLLSATAEPKVELSESPVESNTDSSAPSSRSQVIVHIAQHDTAQTLSIDDYVFGVLAAEGSVEDELEALKAQAVVSRTYALKNLRRHSREGYDLCNTTHCQRYAAVVDAAQRPEFYALVRRAVAETSEEVIGDDKGHVAEAYFSASCGGATADIASLWSATFAPRHLRSRRDEFCDGTPYSAWTDEIKRENLLRALNSDSRSDVGGRLDDIRVLKRDASGRAENVLLEGERRRRISGWDLKIIVGRELGWKILKSSRFEVRRSGDNFVFRGSGFGHGLGLCQSGAHVMARRGAHYRQILAKYLPGTTVTKSKDLAVRSRLPVQFGSNRPIGAFTPPFGSVVHILDAYFRSSNAGAERGRPTRASISSEHFRASFDSDIRRRDIESALNVLERARKDLIQRLEAASIDTSSLSADTELVVHATTGDFVGATGQPAWVAATTKANRIELQPIVTLRKRRVFESALRHEFTHVVVERLSQGRAPRWMLEGLAIHVAGEGRHYRGLADRKRSIAEIELALQKQGSEQEMRSLYAESYAHVGELINREGEAVVWRRAIGRR